MPPSSAEPLRAPLELCDATWRPDGVAVLDRFSLRLEPGAITAVLGRSGCGKSSFLRVLAGLRTLDAGEVRGRPARLGFVFQEPALLPWRSAEANVALTLPAGTPPGAAREVLEAVGLAGRGDALPRALSGGQRMRVSLARALVSRPELLLLDEPFAALDAATLTDMQRLVLDAHASLGCTVVLVTHDRALAARLADRIVVVAGPPLRLSLDLPVAAPRPRSPEMVGELVRLMEAAP